MTQPETPDLNKTEQPEEAWWVEAAKTVGLSLLLAFGIRTFVAEARFIPSGSMQPTLQVDDRLIIDKVTYRFRKPERGDIVVFNPTKSLKRAKFEEAFIKRVVGIPGDRVEIKEGIVWLNGQSIQENYTADKTTTSPSSDSCGNNFKTAELHSKPIDPPVPIFLSKPQTIPANHYLVLGDNRGNSYDGRCWGLVAHDDLVGRAIFRFLPFNRIGTLPEAELVIAD
ncbi:signal peptidase I [Acaryochloris sp. IP29b_bin.148]|uniref:signal peptidase I n=1 Tax=Acaryochloris sp. IP29b_bin.148 TaxID=2969218 RepID=UPI00260D00DA|nr:signal peptidase I [Acaryochloris sp. IP29b_bin.148]